ncbi:M28 family peptidase [Luteimonas sp. S4-F44]|uniref:M28 family peptidase n=1 Tax=Luteimonas sp. S4-F44 TaxID=2925842 RepID=UPI001F539244|nr:M28 family peptidase [Luteimonas sp. S4-F44]UNK41760.1 M28 family peptidase [Luteimonas sp. S4-F44]
MRPAPLLNVLALALLSGALLVPGTSHAREAAPVTQASLDAAAQLRERALQDGTAYRLIESLTTQIGPRLPGSEADARAVAWAKARFAELGYDRVWTEPVTFPKWERRSEHAAVVGPYAQPLVLTALGGSPGGEVSAQIVRFDSLAALEAADPATLRGRIVFVDIPMARSRDGSGYGAAGAIRSRGPSIAARKGAAAYLMRSIGTSPHRVANTGITRFDEDVTPIPAAALSLPDADQLTRLLRLGPIEVALALDCGWNGTYTSQNVIAELTGRERPDEIVLIAGHLDSWDLGTGAVDDASGVGITMAAGHLIAQQPQRPRRSVRVVAFANEEQGLLGARAYADAHGGADVIARHVIGAESDFGAGRIYGFNTSAPAGQRATSDAIAEVLRPLGIDYLQDKGSPGPDISPLAAKGGAWGWLGQDGTDYFDLHHNADDTFDKVDPDAVAQNTAAYAVFAWLAADSDESFGSAPKTDPTPAH